MTTTISPSLVTLANRKKLFDSRLQKLRQSRNVVRTLSSLFTEKIPKAATKKIHHFTVLREEKSCSSRKATPKFSSPSIELGDKKSLSPLKRPDKSQESDFTFNKRVEEEPLFPSLNTSPTKERLVNTKPLTGKSQRLPQIERRKVAMNYKDAINTIKEMLRQLDQAIQENREKEKEKVYGRYMLKRNHSEPGIKYRNRMLRNNTLKNQRLYQISHNNVS